MSSFLVEHHFTGWNQVSATLMLQTALAMRTTTLRLGTAVIVLPWHNPVLLAEQAATLDLISGGRLDFGIGKGYRHNEFAGFRIPPEEAEPRFEESVEVMTKAFTSRAALLAPRQILAVRRHRGRAAAGAAAASAVLGRGRQRSLDPPSRPARLQSHPRPVCFAASSSASASRFTALSGWPAAFANRHGSRSPAKPMSPTTGLMRKPRWQSRRPGRKRTVEVSRAPAAKTGSHVLAYAATPAGTEANALYGTPDEICAQAQPSCKPPASNTSS